MTILEPTTFPRPANAAVVLLDTAQTGILACGMMVLMISGMFDLSIGGILAFSGIMAGLAAKYLGLAADPRVPGRLRLGRAARRHQRHAGHPVQDQRADRDAGDRCRSIAAGCSSSPAPASPTSATATRSSARPRSSASTRPSGSWPSSSCSSPSWSAARATSARPTTSAAMPGRRSCRASMSTARCSASSSSWGFLPASPARCSPRASTRRSCSPGRASS